MRNIVGWSINVNKISFLKNIFNFILLAGFGSFLCEYSIYPLLSQLRQFINAYTNRIDIHDINVHMEANLFIWLLLTV